MNREEVIQRMDLAAREDRERFFKLADTIHLQPKYAPYLSELEILKQYFRDLPNLPDYPDIEWPPVLPEWFPKVNFASKWSKEIYIQEELKEDEEFIS